VRTRRHLVVGPLLQTVVPGISFPQVLLGETFPERRAYSYLLPSFFWSVLPLGTPLFSPSLSFMALMEAVYLLFPIGVRSTKAIAEAAEGN